MGGDGNDYDSDYDDDIVFQIALSKLEILIVINYSETRNNKN